MGIFVYTLFVLNVLNPYNGALVSAGTFGDVDQARCVASHVEGEAQRPRPSTADLLEKYFGKDKNIAYAVMMAESGGNPKAHNKNRNGSIDVGLFQINLKWHPQYTEEEMLDPRKNIEAAYAIYLKSGWKAWSVYKNGSYKKFI